MKNKERWVFGYASLIWKPGFEYVEASPAIAFGYHRALCIYSFIYRGTREEPGLVAGLLSGGSCRGRAYRVASEHWADVKSYLDDRELIYDVYQPKWARVRVGERTVSAYTFVANRAHEQFAGTLPTATAASMINKACGQGGPGVEYLQNTINHLAELGIHDQGLHEVWDAVLSEQRKQH